MAKDKKNPAAPTQEKTTMGGNANATTATTTATQNTAATTENKKKKQPKYQIAINDARTEIMIKHRPKVVKRLIQTHKEITLIKRHAMHHYFVARMPLTDAQIQRIQEDIQKIANEIPANTIQRKYTQKIAL